MAGTGQKLGFYWLQVIAFKPCALHSYFGHFLKMTFGETLTGIGSRWGYCTVEQTIVWASSHRGSALRWDWLSPEVLSRVSTVGTFETEHPEEAPSGRSRQKGPCLLSSPFPNGCPNFKAILMLLWKQWPEGRKLSISLLGKIEQFVLQIICCISNCTSPSLLHYWGPKG